VLGDELLAVHPARRLGAAVGADVAGDRCLLVVPRAVRPRVRTGRAVSDRTRHPRRRPVPAPPRVCVRRGRRADVRRGRGEHHRGAGRSSGTMDHVDDAGPGSSKHGTDAGAWVAPSWDAIVREHSARVYRLAYRLTGNRHDAEDLTQETFVRVFRSLSSYTPGTFEGWLHRITTNLFLDQVRRKQRIRMEAMGDDDGQYPARVEAQPERGFEHTHLDHDVQRALDALSPEYRAAVALGASEGLSYEEIAVTLGIMLGRVRSRMRRARSPLRAALPHRDPAGRAASDGAPTPVAARGVA